MGFGPSPRWPHPRPLLLRWQGKQRAQANTQPRRHRHRWHLRHQQGDGHSREVTLDGIGKINLAEFNFGEAVLGTGKFTQVTLKDNKITFTGKQGTREYEVQNGATIHTPKHGAMPFAPKVGSFSIKDGKLSGQLKISMYIMYLNSYKTRYGKSPSDEITKTLTALNEAKTESTIVFEGTVTK